MLSVILPQLLLAPLFLHGCVLQDALPRKRPFAEQITQAAESAADAMLKVTAMILAFAACMGIMEGMGLFALLPERAAVCVRAVLEVSSVAELLPAGVSLPFAAACLSFGGICVHLQTAAIGGAPDWVRFWLFRLTVSAMTYGICLFGVRCLFRGCIPVSLAAVQPAVTTGSILPGLCLLLMSVMLLRKTDRSAF
jgi:hypothetical protein